MKDLIKIKLDTAQVAAGRQRVGQMLKAASPSIISNTITQITENDLSLLFTVYDEVFFQNWFRDHYAGQIKLSLSRRMIKSAGLTICPKDIGLLDQDNLVIEIRIGVDFFFHYEEATKPVIVCGIETNNSLQALQLVFEHELCHVIEFILFNKSSCKGSRFKGIATNLFGHQASSHQLPTYRQLAREKLGLSIGDPVRFKFEGREIQGIIAAVNKRATVMVRDKKGQFADKKGRRYSKYYVPLNQLSPD